MTTATEKPALSKQQQQFTDSQRSALSTYRELAVGNCSSAFLLHYELLTLLFVGLPGIVGMGARMMAYPSLFASCGKRPALGKGLVLRNPKAIALGTKVLVDDFVTLDARKDSSIVLGDFVSLGRFSTVAAKGGAIELASGVNVGSYCRLATQSKLTVGESTLIAAYCYLGPGNHERNPQDGTYISGDMEIKGGVTIGRNVWIGTRSTIVDGVTVGDNAVIGAHSFVRDDVPAGAVVAGAPARVIRDA